ncbi:hypothetical protein [Clostridium estertheticum]|uniref:hypothetical protein n=1 Tax=Clostridium estertheticum TaxID=238834 RepID=UPI001C0AB14E|nr:hypothetical protein [Clostridium estertheticum]MBU3173388.1 hypothetical protein [Clostridium estertheticum]
MFEKITDKYLSILARDKLKTYYKEQGLDLKEVEKMALKDIANNLDKISDGLEKKNAVLEIQNKKQEDLTLYYESQGLDPDDLKNKNILFDIAYNLQQTNEGLTKRNEVFTTRLIKHELENARLEKENIDINQRMAIQKNNVAMFKKTLDKQYENNSKDKSIKLMEDALIAHSKPLDKDKSNAGLVVDTLINNWVEEGKKHIAVVDNINVGLKNVGKVQENIIEKFR